jgi:hypothetical protein
MREEHKRLGLTSIDRGFKVTDQEDPDNGSAAGDRERMLMEPTTNDQPNAQDLIVHPLSPDPLAPPAQRSLLETKLLEHGGTTVAWQDIEHHAEALLAQGRLFSLPLRLRRDRLGCCGASAAALWGRDIDTYHLATGYALASGVWRPRSWVIGAGALHDTAPGGERYYGLALDPSQAFAFWHEHYFAKVYPGPLGLIRRWAGDEGHRAATAESPELWQQLTARLTSIGGRRVVKLGDEPHLPELLARGRLFTGPVRMHRGERSRCHANAAALWGKDVERYLLVTGYGLSDDGVWRQHSWVVEGETVHETTVARTRYFGLVLDDREACDFWVANFLRARHEGPLSLLAQAAPALR